jgi:hypothetical protein
MAKHPIVQKVQDMFVAAHPQLADKEFRKRMSKPDKMALVTQMLDIARKIEIVNSK